MSSHVFIICTTVTILLSVCTESMCLLGDAEVASKNNGSLCKVEFQKINKTTSMNLTTLSKKKALSHRPIDHMDIFIIIPNASEPRALGQKASERNGNKTDELVDLMNGIFIMKDNLKPLCYSAKHKSLALENKNGVVTPVKNFSTHANRRSEIPLIPTNHPNLKTETLKILPENNINSIPIASNTTVNTSVTKMQSCLRVTPPITTKNTSATNIENILRSLFPSLSSENRTSNNCVANRCLRPTKPLNTNTFVTNVKKILQQTLSPWLSSETNNSSNNYVNKCCLNTSTLPMKTSALATKLTDVTIQNSCEKITLETNIKHLLLSLSSPLTSKVNKSLTNFIKNWHLNRSTQQRNTSTFANSPRDTLKNVREMFGSAANAKSLLQALSSPPSSEVNITSTDVAPNQYLNRAKHLSRPTVSSPTDNTLPNACEIISSETNTKNINVPFSPSQSSDKNRTETYFTRTEVASLQTHPCEVIANTNKDTTVTTQQSYRPIATNATLPSQNDSKCRTFETADQEVMPLPNLLESNTTVPNTADVFSYPKPIDSDTPTTSKETTSYLDTNRLTSEETSVLNYTKETATVADTTISQTKTIISNKTQVRKKITHPTPNTIQSNPIIKPGETQMCLLFTHSSDVATSGLHPICMGENSITTDEAFLLPPQSTELVASSTGAVDSTLEAPRTTYSEQDVRTDQSTKPIPTEAEAISKGTLSTSLIEDIPPELSELLTTSNNEDIFPEKFPSTNSERDVETPNSESWDAESTSTSTIDYTLPQSSVLVATSTDQQRTPETISRTYSELQDVTTDETTELESTEAEAASKDELPSSIYDILQQSSESVLTSNDGEGTSETIATTYSEQDVATNKTSNSESTRVEANSELASVIDDILTHSTNAISDDGESPPETIPATYSEQVVITPAITTTTTTTIQSSKDVETTRRNGLANLDNVIKNNTDLDLFTEILPDSVTTPEKRFDPSNFRLTVDGGEQADVTNSGVLPTQQVHTASQDELSMSKLKDIHYEREIMLFFNATRRFCSLFENGC